MAKKNKGKGTQSAQTTLRSADKSSRTLREHFLAFCEDVIDICENEYWRALDNKDHDCERYFDALATMAEEWRNTAQTASNSAIKKAVSVWSLSPRAQYSVNEHVWIDPAKNIYVPLWDSE
jgi:hypothetical protein